jgi:hypothetical protein
MELPLETVPPRTDADKSTEVLDALHPITAAILADKSGEHRYTDDVMHALQSKAKELLATVGDAVAHAAATPPDPFCQLACEIEIVQARFMDILTERIFPYCEADERSFPADAEATRYKYIEDAFSQIADNLHELSGQYRTAWLAGLLDHVKQAKSAAPALTEAPDSVDTSGDAKDANEPLQPSHQSLQIAIPGLSQLIPAAVTSFRQDDWLGGRDILTLNVSPEQFEALNMRIARAAEYERADLAKAGYYALE